MSRNKDVQNWEVFAVNDHINFDQGFPLNVNPERIWHETLNGYVHNLLIIWNHNTLACIKLDTYNWNTLNS